MIEFDINPDKGITVSKVSVSYTQPGEDLHEELVVSTEDYGAGPFLVIKTEASGWSTTPDEMKRILDDFMGRCGDLELDKQPPTTPAP
jgi:hypothetical protein